MKEWRIKIIMILAYCVPYTYLAMNGDASFGTMIFYGFMIACLGGLCSIAIKTKNATVVIVGNISSFISSYLFTLKYQTEKWEWYFKPFTSFGLLVFITIISLIIQILFSNKLRTIFSK
ncbi:hypothetical protein [Alkaliphilus hydrothermalis]|uniref:Uncharacterized protein n=1 Tax=Alkaliphilus hydrothermalis TaxID=1482730 RepID=A0ABS2NP30_9FIRM|nr:hypothetical protein [Alkaliphilus hydrothermalis]MBM7614334.1 hypothetical protein [Alkaliphilus hydrothermalis]